MDTKPPTDAVISLDALSPTTPHRHTNRRLSSPQLSWSESAGKGPAERTYLCLANASADKRSITPKLSSSCNGRGSPEPGIRRQKSCSSVKEDRCGET